LSPTLGYSSKKLTEKQKAHILFTLLAG